MFTTGSRILYDQLYNFLPMHGFDEVLSETELKQFSERDLGIHPEDWELTTKARVMEDWACMMIYHLEYWQAHARLGYKTERRDEIQWNKVAVFH